MAPIEIGTVIADDGVRHRVLVVMNKYVHWCEPTKGPWYERKEIGPLEAEVTCLMCIAGVFTK